MSAVAGPLRLAAATPLSAREVVYLGEGARAFAGAWLRAAPKGRVRLPDAPGPAPDVVVADASAPLPALLRALERFGGALFVLQLSDKVRGAVQGRLAGGGWRLRWRGAPGSEGVLLASTAAAWLEPLLHVEMWAFSPRLMDIRTSLPTEQLAADPRISARMQTFPFTLPDLPPGLPKVLILQRPRPLPPEGLYAFIAPAVARGWAVVLEFDDHPELTARANNRAVTELDWLRFQAVFGVQTTTPRLAEVFAAHNDEVRLFPNAVFSLPPFRDAPRPPRVFYGAISRGPFALEVARSLAATVAQAPETEFVVLGDQAVFEALPTARKTFVDYQPYGRYLELMAGCAVALSPLAGETIEQAKSDAKFLDAAAAGTLMIASPAVYGEVVRHGETGLIAQRLEDWAPLLTRALTDETERLRMTRAAWAYVRDQRMFAEQAEARRRWYLDLWSRREALAQAAFRRAPGLEAAVRRAAPG